MRLGHEFRLGTEHGLRLGASLGPLEGDSEVDVSGT
jgi:hypothetical protein